MRRLMIMVISITVRDTTVACGAGRRIEDEDERRLTSPRVPSVGRTMHTRGSAIVVRDGVEAHVL